PERLSRSKCAEQFRQLGNQFLRLDSLRKGGRAHTLYYARSGRRRQGEIHGRRLETCGLGDGGVQYSVIGRPAESGGRAACEVLNPGPCAGYLQFLLTDTPGLSLPPRRPLAFRKGC